MTGRIGVGADSHRVVAGRPLVLGGVRIPHDRGLDGHSDGRGGPRYSLRREPLGRFFVSMIA